MTIRIFQSLCGKIAQSVVVVGLYYGFLTTFSIGPSFFFLIQTRVMEEGTEKDVASATGFVVGQLIMFVSVYYLPLHLALSQPHTITILVVLYLFFHFLSYKGEDFLDYEYGLTTQNSMRNLSIQCVFLNNLICQLLNHFILPSSTLARLVNIYMFRCNNKILFVTSSFVAWFIGQILFTKWLGLVLFWIRQTYAYAYGSKKYKGLVLHWKYTLLDWTCISSMDQVFRIPLVAIFLFYLGRVPYPLINQKLRKTKAEKLERKEWIKERNKERQEKRNGKTTSKTKSTQLVIQEKQEKTESQFTRILVTILFDSRRWNRPLRYIKNNPLYEGAVQDIPVQNEMGQYYFGTCRSDGKKRISFTYRPGFKDFLESLTKRFAFVYFGLFKKEMRLRRLSKLSKSQEYLYNNWIYSNEQKKYNLINELRSRIKVLEEKEGFLALDILEKRARLCNDENEQECFSKRKDPLLNGPDRSTMDISEIYEMRNRKKEDPKEKMEKLEKMEDPKEKEERKKKFGIMPILTKDSIPSIKWMSPSDRLRLMEQTARAPRRLIYTIIVTDPTTQKVKTMSKFGKLPVDVFAGEYEEMQKDVPKWLTDFMDDVEVNEEKQEKDEDKDEEEKEAEEKEKKKGKEKQQELAEIALRKFKHILIYTIDEDDLLEDEKKAKKDLASSQQSDEDEPEEVTLLNYSHLPDFSRGLIRGSMRALRRKTVIWDLYQPYPRSPIFLDRTENTLFSFFRRIFFSVFDIFLKLFEKRNVILRNSVGRKPEWKISQEEETKEMDLEKKKKNRKMKRKQNEEEQRQAIAEAWDVDDLGQQIRGLTLLTHSYLRKSIVLPSLIIAKNLGRMVLFQSPEWDEDFKEWDKEMHVKCTYDGLELSETEFPENWLEDGIQIKILFPFRLKPWRRSKNRKEQPKKSCFLTVYGKETDVPFGSPRRQPSFFRPIYKELEKKMREVKKKFFPLFEVLKEKEGGIIQKGNKRKVYEPTENGKDSKINKNIIDEPTIGIRSMNWTIESLIERKMQNLSDRTIRIRNEIEQITKEKNKILFICDDKRPESQKPIWKIFQRKSIRLIRKSHYFIKFFIEKTYINILLWMINNLPRTRINSQLFFESIKKMINKFIYKNKTNQEGREERDKNTMNFFCTQKKNHSKMDYDLSSLSQAYVFYKLSQSPLFNKYHLRSLLQYHETYPFIKDQIKDYCRGIFDSKSRHKKMTKSQSWKNWLRGHYQYNLSQTKWSQLEPQEWRNRIHQHCMITNKDSMTLDSYKKEKDNVIDYVKQNSYGFDSFPSIKEKLQKHYRYDLLSNIYMNYGDKKDLSIYRFVSIAISDHLEGAFYPFYPWKNRDRKYVDCRILLTKKSNIDTCTNNNKLIKTWANTLIGGYKNTQTEEEIIQNNLNKRYMGQKEDQKEDSDKKKDFLDWKKMNKEWKKRDEERVVGSNRESWFFPELVLLLNAYKKKPWITPIELLLFDLDPCKDTKNQDTKNQDTKNGKKKKPEPVQEGKTYYVKKYNEEEEDFKVQVRFGAYQRKELGEEEKKKEVRKVNDIEEFDFLVTKSFLHQFRLDNPHTKKRIMRTIDVSYHLLRLWKEYFKEKEEGVPMSRKRDPKKMTLATIDKKEVDLQLMDMVQDPSDSVPILLENKFLIFEEFRLCQKIDGKSILYQMISINTSPVNQNQHQTQDFLRPEDILSSRRCRELRILSSFNYPNWNVTDRKPFYVNKYMNQFDLNKENITNSRQLLNVFNEEELNTDANEFVKCKSFLWPNYRLEDLLCMNRYWFDTNNGSRFSMLRIHMYPQFRIKK